MSDTEINFLQSGGLEALTQTSRDDAELLAELSEAEVANIHGRGCQVCEALSNMSELARINVERALAGTIGEEKLATILTRNGYPTGRRAIQNHRRQDHS